MYEVTHADLARAGEAEGALRGEASWDSESLAMSHFGEAIPIWVRDGGDGRFEAGDSLVFAGEHLEGEVSFLNVHSDTNVYWLSVEGDASPQRYLPADDSAKDCPTTGSALASQRLERDFVRVRFSSREDRLQEAWFWHKLTQIDDAPFEQELDLSDLDSESPLPVRLQIHLRGWSRLGRTVKKLGEDHAVEVLWDGQPIAEAQWSNVVEGKLLTVENIPADLLSHEVHRVGVRVVPRLLGESKDPQVDVVLFNWLELTYPRRPAFQTGQHHVVVASAKKGAVGGTEAVSGTEEGAVDGTANSPVDGVEETGCAEFSSDSNTFEVFSRDGVQWSAAKRDEIVAPPGASLWAVVDHSWLRPEGVVLDNPSTLRNASQQVDYLMIAHSELLEAAAPLAEFHRQRGLTVSLVDVEDVYDEFNDGIVHPRALKAFVQHAFQQYQSPAPRYVLLVGDASWDPRVAETEDGEQREYADWTFQPRHQTRFGTNRSTPYATPASLGHRNLLPTGGYSHSEGEAASDNWFVAVDGDDDKPDLAIGRFPVTEPEEVSAIVAKTISYMADPEPGDWRREVLWISDGTNLRDSTSDILAGSLAGRGLSARKVKPDRNSVTNDQHRDNLLSAFQEGQVLVHFSGHGGRYIWRTAPADFKKNRDLFTLADLDNLPPGGRLPVVVSMTCYSAPFDHPTADSIGEKFLRLPDRGAVAVIAASWRTSAPRRLSSQIMEELVLPGRTVGEALQNVKQVARQRDFVHMYNLLGDPALPLALPTSVDELDISMADVPVLTASLEVDAALEGSLEWVDSSGDLVFQQEVEVEPGTPLVASYAGPREDLEKVLTARLFLQEPETGRSWVGGGTLEEIQVDLSNFSSPKDAFKKKPATKSRAVKASEEEAIKAKAAQQAGQAGEKQK